MMKQWIVAGGAMLVAAVWCGCAGGILPAAAAETGSSQADPAAQIAHGKTLFISYGCGWCHEGGGRKAGKCPQLMSSERDDDFILMRGSSPLSNTRKRTAETTATVAEARRSCCAPQVSARWSKTPRDLSVRNERGVKGETESRSVEQLFR